MHIAVVICTYNRADRLAGCISSLLTQTLSPSVFEIVIVDDGSTDQTAHVCSAYAHSPNVRVIRQQNTGLGAARERGWRATAAPLVAFIDDDAEAPPNWLATVIQHFDQNIRRSDAPAVLGGPARPIWEIARPAWLDDSLAAWLTAWEPYTDYRESKETGLFVGANMTFRRDALQAIGGFSPSLGRRGNNLLSHEESELWERLRDAGHCSAYDPAAWVHHHIPAIRMRPAWFRRRIFWEGVSMIRRQRPAADPARFDQAMKVFLPSLVSKPVRDDLFNPHRWGRSLRGQLHLAYCLGCAREWARPSPCAQ